MESSNIFSGKGKGKGGGSSGPVLCTVRGSTNNPTYPWCPEDMDIYPDQDCYDIANGDGPTDGSVAQFRVDFALEIDGDVVETLERIEDYLQRELATDLAGCGGEDDDENNVIDNVIFDVVEDTDSGRFVSVF